MFYFRRKKEVCYRTRQCRVAKRAGIDSIFRRPGHYQVEVRLVPFDKDGSERSLGTAMFWTCWFLGFMPV